jgi:Pilus formation protein N terminal region
MMPKLRLGFCAALFAAALTTPAAADTVITVKSDQAKMLNIAGVAGTVVVGNPNIADVSVRGSQVFVHGKIQGVTNVIILDREGVQLASIEVNVESGAGSPIAVYGAGRRYSYNCAPNCEASLHVGDSYEDYFKILAQENANKTGLASGTVAADAGGGTK